MTTRYMTPANLTSLCISRYKTLRVLLTIVAIFGPMTAWGQASIIVNVEGRSTATLNGNWQTIVDPFENGYYSYRYEPKTDGYFLNRKPNSPLDLVEYDFDTSQELAVPGDWNTQRPDLFFYEGTIWYKRSFGFEKIEHQRVFVHFGAANYDAKVYLNGALVGTHVGGFTPFAFEITDHLRDTQNDLIVKVDNKRHREGVPTLNTDWWNYGGLTRGVRLVKVPATFIRDYVVQLRSDDRTRVAGWVQLDGPDTPQQVAITIPEIGVQARVMTNQDGYAAFEFEANLELWSPENPRLYTVRVAAVSDQVTDRIGFRTIEVVGSRILLNDEPVFLKGISVHEEAPMRGGRAFSTEDSRTLLGWAKELGCNFVRLAHYPHNETMVREADRMGIMVWSEIPVYWTILWDNPETFDLARRQLEEMVVRDRNRASVVVWSVGNETPRLPARLDFMTRLVNRIREMDDTRLVTAATELSYLDGRVLLDDPLARHLDVIGANEYVGWYSGSLDSIEEMTWESEFDKPLIISEFGAGALQGYHADAGVRWTEEYQAELYRRQIEMAKGIPFLAGMSPWLLADFRSPRRPLPRIQDYWNRKGLVSERGQKKAAFYVLQDYYLGGTVELKNRGTEEQRN